MDNGATKDIIVWSDDSRPGQSFLGTVSMRRVRFRCRLKTFARWTAAMAAVASLSCSSAQASETRAYLLRGWFGVFSTGMDELASDLKGKGIKAEAIGHLAWKSAISKIVQDKAAGKIGALALIGHSQGAINVIEMAQALKAHKIQVDLLVTLVPAGQNPVPNNVVRAMNFYQSPGWGSAITAEPGFRGKLQNIDLSSELTITHITIDKSAKVQGEIARAILAIPKAKESASPREAAQPAAPSR
jgi:hypothetical protein